VTSVPRASALRQSEWPILLAPFSTERGGPARKSQKRSDMVKRFAMAMALALAAFFAVRLARAAEAPPSPKASALRARASTESALPSASVSTESALPAGASTESGLRAAGVSTESALAAAAASTESMTGRPAEAPDPALDALLARMDAKAKETKTVEADIAITTSDNFSGHETVRVGKLYLKKPDSIFIDLVRTDVSYPQKIWINSKEIVNYRPDQNTGEKMTLGDEKKEQATVIGLSTTSAELRADFSMALRPAPENAKEYVLVLTPKPTIKVDFTSAEVTIDSATLLPVKIIETNAELEEVKTYALSNVKVNPRLADRLFTPNYPKSADIEELSGADWKGP